MYCIWVDNPLATSDLQRKMCITWSVGKGLLDDSDGEISDIEGTAPKTKRFYSQLLLHLTWWKFPFKIQVLTAATNTFQNVSLYFKGESASFMVCLLPLDK